MATKKDFTQIAFAVVQAATGAAPKPFDDAQIKARNAGLKGGKGRMAKLTEAERQALSAKGVAARKKAPTVKVGAKSVSR